MASWTLTNLTTEMGLYLTTWGAFEHTSTSLYGLIGRKLREFASETRCYFADNMTATVSTAEIDLPSKDFTLGALTVRVLEVDQVRIPATDSVLLHLDSAALGYGRNSFQTEASGTPNYWSLDSRLVLRLHPAPSASTDIAVRGFYYPPAITSASAGSATIVVPDEAENALIEFLVASVMETSADEAGMNAYAQRITIARAKMSALRDRYCPAPPWNGQFLGARRVISLG